MSEPGRAAANLPSRRASAWLVVGLLWAVALLNYLDRQAIFSLFPLLRSELRLSDIELGLLGTSFLWVYAFFSPGAGYLGDRFGYRGVILASLVAWSLITAATGLAGNATQLLAARALMGISEACYLPSALAMIAAFHPEATRSRAVGLHQSGIYAGIILGGGGAAWIGENLGWRAVFFVLGAVGVLYGALLVFALPSPASGRSAKHFPGFLSSASAAWRAPGFRWILLVFSVLSLANWLVYTWMPLFLYERFGLSLTQAAFGATFYSQLASVAGILLGGWLADAWARRALRGRIWTQMLGLLMAGTFLMLTGLTDVPAVCYLALAAYGIGRGFYDCNVMPVLCRVVSYELRSTAYGVLNFAGTLVGGAAALGGGVLKSSLGLKGAIQMAAASAVLCSVALLRVPQAAPTADER